MDYFSEEFQPALNVWLFWSILCYSVSFISGNYSQVDKLWSVTPWLYMWQWFLEDVTNNRVLLMAVLSSLWGLRLTYNFNRRGGYKWPPWDGEEDYRWEHVRNNPLMQADKNPIRWQIFNLSFVCLYQHFLLLLIASPAFIVLQSGIKSIGVFDVFCALLFLSGLWLEVVADNAQFAFQEEKHRKYKLIKQEKMTKDELTPMEKDGFLSEGVWSLCRHPNYAGEQLMWFSMYLFSAQVELVNWSILGIILLCCLFTPSAQLSEGITGKKYPNYTKFLKAKFMFLPFGGKYVANSNK